MILKSKSKWLISFLFFSVISFAEVDKNSDQIGDKSLTTKTAEEISVKEKTEKSISTKETEAGQSLTENKSEKEIPLNLESKKNVATAESSVFKIFLFVGILGTLLAGAWVFLRKYKTQSVSKNHNEIKVLAQHHFGTKKSIAVVRVAGESMLVGITDNQINLIKALSLLDDELPEVAPRDFKQVMKERNVNEENALSESEDFSIKGIKDIVSTKLKNMRSI